MKAQLIEAENGEQIVILPPGFEFAAEEVQPTMDGDRVIILLIPADQDPES